MDYSDVLKMAGATVHAYREFGSYQGDWLAKVTFNGREGWIRDYYGSCSGCDALQGEVGFAGHECGSDDWYNPLYEDDGFRAGCPKCQELKARAIALGAEYLDDILTQEKAEAVVSENLDWDTKAKEMLAFLREHSAKDS